MEEFHELIKYLKDNGYEKLKVDQDLLCGIIEYFASKQETKKCNIANVGNFAYLVQDKNTLLNHGLFTSEEKAKNYINGRTKYAIKKFDIA